jgi:hypothetical protein
VLGLVGRFDLAHGNLHPLVVFIIGVHLGYVVSGWGENALDRRERGVVTSRTVWLQSYRSIVVQAPKRVRRTMPVRRRYTDYVKLAKAVNYVTPIFRKISRSNSRM